MFIHNLEYYIEPVTKRQTQHCSYVAWRTVKQERKKELFAMLVMFGMEQWETVSQFRSHSRRADKVYRLGGRTVLIILEGRKYTYQVSPYALAQALDMLNHIPQ